MEETIFGKMKEKLVRRVAVSLVERFLLNSFFPVGN
jgi:hypothetical protein